MSLSSDEEVPPPPQLRPLVVELDGTLLRSDIYVESFLVLVSTSFLKTMKALFQFSKGVDAFKAYVVHYATLDYAALPFHQDFLAWLRTEKNKGRPIYLASSLPENEVRGIADHLGIFTGIFATADTPNMTGGSRAHFLCSIFGEGKFDYAGNKDRAMDIWEKSGSVIGVNVERKLGHIIRDRFPDARLFPSPRLRLMDCLKAMRLHQWLKNLLIFVPAFTAHRFDTSTALQCLLAFLSFSFCASSVYILNDLLDLRHDRQHHSKHLRPLAAGRIDLRYGILLLTALLAFSVAIGALLPWKFLVALSAYYLMTLAYSIYLKRHMILDVITLSLLYSARLVAGGVAIAVILSPWLLSFSTFLFLSFALIKRCSEITAKQAQAGNDLSGRGYRLSDLPILENMASASGYVAALTSGLYISSPIVTELYSHPERLWAIPVILLFWMSRILMLTHRGEMHDDPVFFALRDRTSIVCGLSILVIVLISI